jgi:hypothetical protein
MSHLFPTAVYSLCFATSTACALLLFANYRRTGARLLAWSALCFIFLAANALVVIFDMLVLPDWDFRLARTVLSLAAVGVLLFGLIWDREA